MTNPNPHPLPKPEDLLAEMTKELEFFQLYMSTRLAQLRLLQLQAQVGPQPRPDSDIAPPPGGNPGKPK